MYQWFWAWCILLESLKGTETVVSATKLSVCVSGCEQELHAQVDSMALLICCVLELRPTASWPISALQSLWVVMDKAWQMGFSGKGTCYSLVYSLLLIIDYYLPEENSVVNIYLVPCAGNPGVFLSIPVPLPTKTRTPGQGYGFFQGYKCSDPWVDPYPYPWRVLWVTHRFLLYFTSSIDNTYVMLVIILVYTCLHLSCCVLTHFRPIFQRIMAPVGVFLPYLWNFLIW